MNFRMLFGALVLVTLSSHPALADKTKPAKPAKPAAPPKAPAKPAAPPKASPVAPVANGPDAQDGETSKIVDGSYEVIVEHYEAPRAKPDGTAWDAGGEAPDLQFSIRDSGQKQGFTAGQLNNTFVAEGVHLGPVNLTARGPMVITISDVDAFSGNDGIVTITIDTKKLTLANGGRVAYPLDPKYGKGPMQLRFKLLTEAPPPEKETFAVNSKLVLPELLKLVDESNKAGGDPIDREDLRAPGVVVQGVFIQACSGEIIPAFTACIPQSAAHKLVTFTAGADLKGVGQLYATSPNPFSGPALAGNCSVSLLPHRKEPLFFNPKCGATPPPAPAAPASGVPSPHASLKNFIDGFRTTSSAEHIKAHGAPLKSEPFDFETPAEPIKMIKLTYANYVATFDPDGLFDLEITKAGLLPSDSPVAIGAAAPSGVKDGRWALGCVAARLADADVVKGKVTKVTWRGDHFEACSESPD